MSIENRINRPCVIVTRTESGTTDPYGNEIPNEGAIETVCEAQPRSSVEPENQAELSEEDWTLFFLPADIGLVSTADAIWIPDLFECEVVGAPMPWRNPRTRQEHYLHVNVRRVAGAEDAVS